MTPIDRELERALADRASGLIPPGDLLAGFEREARGIRRRRGTAIGAAALSVLAVAVAVPLATRDGAARGRDVQFATQPPAPGTASPGVSSPTATPDYADLGWPERGSLKGDTALRDRALDTLMSSFDEPFRPQQYGVKLLWAEALPDGRRVVVLQTSEVRADSQGMFASFYAEQPDGSGGRIVHRTEIEDRNPQAPTQGRESQTRLPQVSAYVDGDEDFVVIVGAPTTGQLEFSTDGRRYTTVETVEGTGIVAVTKGENRGPYAVRIYDGNGEIVYDGPIDLPSED